MTRKARDVAARGRADVQVSLKLAEGADRAKCARALAEVPGVRKLIQVFPDEDDPSLATLYVAEVDPSLIQSTVRAMREEPGVEYVEAPAPRKLIR